MKSRLAASVALGALVVFGATGCTFITPQSTTLAYSASDGVNVDGTGPVLVRNAMFVVNDEGTAANFVVSVFNSQNTPQTLVIQLETGESVQLALEPQQVIHFGGDTEPLSVPQFSAPAGSNVSVYFQSGNENGAKAFVPVLDGTLSYYSDLAP